MAKGEGLIIEIIADATKFASGVKSAVSKAKESFKGIGDELGKELKRVDTVGTTAFKGVLGTIGTVAAGATAAIGGIVTSSVNAFAEFEQLKGGVETLFGEESAKTILKYADEAFYKAGVSANTYMETVTSFSASLLQSLGGDTEKAAEYANRAMEAMSDNANKMGTNIESIQNAYQGFAKQNYTMLDNLKLGYGGTQEEMERLIADAASYTDQQRELNVAVNEGDMSFGNIVNAIAVVQQKMGIAGVTADEAVGTISGSLNMLGAAWENLQVAIAKGDSLDKAISDVIFSVEAVIDNAGPAIKQSLQGLAELISKAVPSILKSSIPTLVEDMLPAIGNAAITLIETLSDTLSQNVGKLVTFIGEAAPRLIETGVQLVTSLVEGIAGNLSTVKDSAGTIIDNLIEGIHSIMDLLLPIAKDLVGAIADGFIEYKALIFEMGIDIITSIAEGLAEASPELGPKLIDTVMGLVDVLIENMPTFLESCITIIGNIVNSIWENLPEILGKISTLIHDLVNTLLETIGTWGPALLQILASIAAAILVAIGAFVITIVQKLFDWWNDSAAPWFEKIGEKISTWWEGVKKTAGEKLEAIKTAVKEKVEAIKENISSKIDTIKTNVSSKIEAIKSNISDKVTAIKTGISDKVNEIKENISTKVGEIKDKVVNTIEELPGKMLSIGENIVTGIWEGISGAASWLEEKVTGFIDNITGWFTGLWDEHSPSKVFEKIGSYLGEGLGIGIEGETNSLKNIVSNQVGELTGMYSGINLSAPKLSFAGSTLAQMGQSSQTITNDNGNVFNFTQYFSGSDESTGATVFREFQRKVRYAGGVL